MGLTYFEVLRDEFGEREFSTRDLSTLLGGGRAAKILSELKMRGLVARTGRGRYRVLRGEETPDLRLLEWERIKSIVLSGPDPKAWSDSTAVEVWTDGSYRLAPNPFMRVFYLAVPRGRISEWRAYLESKGVSLGGGKRVGGSVKLIPRTRLRVERHGAEPVIPLTETRRLIREHPALYADAGALLADRS